MLMSSPEGRKDVFYVLQRYWPQNALDNVILIYDFACSADEYMLNREPFLFAKMRPFIDEFHSKGHLCEELYNLLFFPHEKNINSSSMESLNKFAQLFRPQLAYMHQKIAVQFLNFIMGAHNYYINKKLQQQYN
jgi:hypothetical protein